MLLALLPSAYVPDDGTQGYTPYYYKMDVPVRVRNSISYGRAWQVRPRLPALHTPLACSRAVPTSHTYRSSLPNLAAAPVARGGQQRERPMRPTAAGGIMQLLDVAWPAPS